MVVPIGPGRAVGGPDRRSDRPRDDPGGRSDRVRGPRVADGMPDTSTADGMRLRSREATGGDPGYATPLD